MQKQHTNKLNCSRPFYLLWICSKKTDGSEFHNDIQNFEFPTTYVFFEGQQEQENSTKTYCWWLKYFTAVLLVITTI